MGTPNLDGLVTQMEYGTREGVIGTNLSIQYSSALGQLQQGLLFFQLMRVGDARLRLRGGHQHRTRRQCSEYGNDAFGPQGGQSIMEQRSGIARFYG